MAEKHRRGVAFMLATMVVFASQDGVSKLLASEYDPVTIAAIRYWAFALFVLAMSARRPGGVRAAARTAYPVLQILRGAMLAVQIVLITHAFALIGLAATHAVMASYTLMIAAASGLVLGERVPRAVWAAIAVGFVGVVILLRPGREVFDPAALLPLTSAAMFAAYGLLTRRLTQRDGAATSFFYIGVGGAGALTLLAPFFWTPLAPEDWPWMGALCVTGALGHYLYIKAYEASEAARLQPYAYLQLVFAAAIGVVAFGERIDLSLALGGAIVAGAGLFSLIAGARAARRDAALSAQAEHAARPRAE